MVCLQFHAVSGTTPDKSMCPSSHDGPSVGMVNTSDSSEAGSGHKHQVMGADCKTVITLDMQLYEKTKQLEMSRPDCKNKWILRIGELHTTMAALRAAGSLIEGSGIDDAWIEADLYGPATVRQILECKHYKRALGAHLTTLQTLHTLYLRAFFRDNPESENEMLTLASSISAECINGKDLDMLHESFTTALRRMSEKFSDFTDKGSEVPMFRVFFDYMNFILLILSFIKATRKGDWELHLASLSAICKYFFALDQLKYARMVPLYLAEMTALEETDPDIWNEFKTGNFVVNKSNVPYSAVGPDHAIEHANRSMKVTGGLIGITLNENARNRFFLIAPELARLSDEIQQTGSSSQVIRAQHHELSLTMTKKLDDYVSKLLGVLSSQNPFLSEDKGLINLMTQTCMNEEIVEDLCRLPELGKMAYTQFVEARIISNAVKVFDPMKKMRLKVWKVAGKVEDVKIGQKNSSHSM